MSRHDGSPPRRLPGRGTYGANERGYIARNQIDVRVDDLDRLGPAIDAAGASGATSMAGLRFDLKDRAGAEREALRLAVEDAMARAKAIAAGANDLARWLAVPVGAADAAAHRRTLSG